MIRGIFVSLLLATSAGALELCFAPSTHPSGLGRNVSVDCKADPDAFDNDWIGYSTTGSNCSSGITSCADPHDYLWTLSRSATDPFANSGPLVDKLYLWFVCTNQNGLSAGAFDLVGDLPVLGLVPANGCLFIGNAPQLLFAVPSGPTGPLLVAELVMSQVPVSVDGSSWGGVKALYR